MNVNADARRISQALTEPEYLEAWISIPDQVPGSSLCASLCVNGYRLEHQSADGNEMKIVGSYLFRHQRKMRLVWRRMHSIAGAESLVDFRLRGNFGRSIVEVRHMRLTSIDEYHWHRMLWHGSLQKLAILMQ